MDILSVTIGLPVKDLGLAVQWYRKHFSLAGPDLQQAGGVAEFPLGAVWLQLGDAPTTRSGAEAVVRLGVPDASTEHRRLARLRAATTKPAPAPRRTTMVEAGSRHPLRKLRGALSARRRRSPPARR